MRRQERVDYCNNPTCLKFAPSCMVMKSTHQRRICSICAELFLKKTCCPAGTLGFRTLQNARESCENTGPWREDPVRRPGSKVERKGRPRGASARVGRRIGEDERSASGPGARIGNQASGSAANFCRFFSSSVPARVSGSGARPAPGSGVKFFAEIFEARFSGPFRVPGAKRPPPIRAYTRARSSFQACGPNRRDSAWRPGGTDTGPERDADRKAHAKSKNRKRGRNLSPASGFFCRDQDET